MTGILSILLATGRSRARYTRDMVEAARSKPLRARLRWSWGCVASGYASIFIQMVEYTPLDHTLTALADPTRRSILGRLAAGEARVTEVAAPFGMSLNAVSKHIRVLERAGLVRRRVSGREHLLALDLAPLEAASRWMEEQRAQWSWRLAELDKILKEEKP